MADNTDDILSNYDSTDLGSLINNQLDKSVIGEGKMHIFGRTINVGHGGAEALRSAVQTLTDNIAFEGAKYARHYSSSFAKALNATDHKAEKIGAWADVGWRFGLPVTNFLLGMRTSLGEGHRQMARLAQESTVVLAANNKKGVGGVMSTGFSALNYERKRVFENGKKSMLSNIAGLVSSLPGVLINYWSWQRDLINDPTRPIRELGSQYSEEQYKIAAEKSSQLQAMQTQVVTSRAPGQLGTPDSMSRFFKPRSLGDLEKNISQSRIVGPILGGLGAQFIVGDIERKSRNESAWQTIKDLKMRLANEEPETGHDIEDSVRDIFTQHAQDIGSHYKLAGHRFDNIVEKISDALVNDSMHPEAIVELLDNRNVIKFGNNGIVYGNAPHVNHAVDALVEKYAAKVDQKAFFKNAPFTPKDAVEAFNRLPDDEKPFFAMMFPTGILENAGADKAMLSKAREIGRDYFVDEITTAILKMLSAGPEDLAKHGLSETQIEELEDIRKEFTNAAKRGRPNEYVMDNRGEVTNIVRKITLTNKKPEDLWQDYIKGGRSENRRERSDATMVEKYARDNGEDKSSSHDIS